MSFTFTTLRETVQDYTQNDETSFIANMGMFVELAEERVLKSVQLNEFQKNAAGTMASGNQFLNVPSDFLAPFSLSITNSSNYVFLMFKDLDYVQTYNPNPATTGTPKYYAQFDVNNLLIGPTPDAAYTTTLSYFYRPASLTESLLVLTVGATGSFTNGETITGGTSGVVSTIKSITGATSGATTTVTSTGADTTVSWMSENAEIALLYGTLIEASTYMKGEQDVMAMYNSRFAEAISRLKNFGEAEEVSDEYRTGQIRRQKS